MTGRRRVALLVALMALGLAGVGAEQGTAQEPTREGILTTPGRPLEDPAMEAEATRIASELRCPVCQGLSIQDSPSPLAQQMKDVIRAQLESGQSPAQVKQYFISKYGEWVLLEPEASGFNLLVYLIPWLALLAGAGVIFLAVRRWTGAPEEQPHTS